MSRLDDNINAIVTPVDKMVDHLRRVQDTKIRMGLDVMSYVHVYTVNEKVRKQFPKYVLLVERKLHKTRKEHLHVSSTQHAQE